MEAGANVNAVTQRNATPLYVACQKGYLDIVQYLLEHDADKTICFQNGFTPLHIAAQDQSLEVVQYLISEGIDVLAKSHQGQLASEVTTHEEICACINDAIQLARKALAQAPSATESQSAKDTKTKGKKSSRRSL
jgi:ankyrin repeat protein